MPKNKKINIRFLAWATLACAAFILSFTLILRFTLRKTTDINLLEYSLEVPANFQYEYSISETEEAFIISGYANISGEKLYKVNSHVVLYNTANEEYFLIPTNMDMGAEVNMPQGAEEYGYAKFSAIVLKRQLNMPFEEYSLGILYQSNSYNNLILSNNKLTGDSYE